MHSPAFFDLVVLPWMKNQTKEVNMDRKSREKVATFRFNVISELILGDLKGSSRSKLIQKKARELWEIPFSTRQKISETTILEWLRLYKQGGFEALLPKYRSDLGVSRSLPQEITDALLSVKEEKPQRSVPTLLKILRETGVIPLDQKVSDSSIYRLLREKGWDRRAKGESVVKLDRRKFTFDHAQDLYQGDVMYGPYLVNSQMGKKMRTYLIAFIDDATRLIPHAQFCFSEKAREMLRVFKKAILRRGVPKRLFVDNGSTYRFHQLEVICASLGIALLHARPYSGPSKGKQERWFRTVREQFLSELDFEGMGIETLNSQLWAWIEGEYHRTPHRGLEGKTPLDQWLLSGETLTLSPTNLDELFLYREKRRVYADRTFSLEARLYETEARFIGETVEVRYDPEDAKKRAYIYEREKRVAEAHLVDLSANCHVKRNPISFSSLTKNNPKE